MSQMTVEELNDLIRREFPQSKVILETISPRRCCVRIPINSSHLRPGGTVSGPTMMSLADNAMYLALLAEIGPVLLAVTTNLNIHLSGNLKQTVICWENAISSSWGKNWPLER